MSPRFLTCLVSTFRSIILHPICCLQARVPYLRFFHLNALVSCFCSTINVTSLFFVFSLSLFFFPVESPHISLLPLAFFAFASILHVVQCAASAFIVLCCSFCCCCCRLCFFLQFSQRQWHISIDVVVLDVTYLRLPLWLVFTTIWSLTDTCFSVQFMKIKSRGMLRFT